MKDEGKLPGVPGAPPSNSNPFQNTFNTTKTGTLKSTTPKKAGKSPTGSVESLELNRTEQAGSNSPVNLKI